MNQMKDLAYRHNYSATNYSEEILGQEVLDEFRDKIRTTQFREDGGIMYASIETFHEIEDMLIKYFSLMYKHTIIIESNRGCYIGGHDNKEIMAINADLLDVVSSLQRNLFASEGFRGQLATAY